MSNENAIPEVALLIYDDGNQITLEVHTPKDPNIKRHASLGLMYGLAILSLDRQGIIDETVQHFLADGPMNEIDCRNAISLLLQDTENETPT